MDRDRRAEIIARLSAAYPGPWEHGPNPTWNPERGPSGGLVVRPAGEFPHGEWIADCGLPSEPTRQANAALIAAAPADLAYLLWHLARAEEDIEELVRRLARRARER